MTRTQRDRSQAPPDAWTVGHSTRELSELLDLLAVHGVERVADVRRFPASRRHPQFQRESLAAALGEAGLGYRWFEALGGRRAAARDSPNRGLTTAGFRGYADYMATPEFGSAFDELVGWMREGRTALLCAERLWWQCHRRLLADLLVARGGVVRHVLGPEPPKPHELWSLAVAAADGVVYPPPQGELGLTDATRPSS